MRAIDYFDRGARLAPSRAAFVKDDDIVSYAEAASLTNRIAVALLEGGAGPNTKVAVYSPNRIDAFLIVLGVLRAGAVWVPINIRNGVEENIQVLRNTECTWLFYHGVFEAAADAMRAAVSDIRAIRLDADDEMARWMAAPGAVAPALPLNPDRLCAVLSTGGTTGHPKGVMWRDATLEAMTANFWAHLPCEQPPVYLIAAPMTHAAGVIALPLMAVGATVVILDRADPLTIMQAIQHHRITHLFLPPTVIYMMLAHARVRQFDYSSLAYFIYSAAPMAAAKIKEAVSVFGPVMAQAYGQAEFPLMGTFLSPREHAQILAEGPIGRLQSAGRACMFNQLAIVDDSGRPARPRDVGEIVFRGNLAMVGYYKDAPATAAVSCDGWHHTGDLGYLDEDGYVYIVDRQKDMIITGGFNVYSAEVEQVILTHPAVQDCVVIGVPDDKWGEAVKAVVELKPGLTTEAEAIVVLCRDRLGGVKAPKTVEVWSSLPRSAVGKVLKRVVRDRYWQHRDRQI
ncbi:AMP-binding protein [Reyranella sp. CPCC 100927]|uniref:AMP-binding protein n=1 Tax=Reyranella sp. CPCC 100927 TaxID=2599616 RepID=UPI0011B67CF2|nr:AMP-binding protein [Reyranella sp. CPCC 100927]TWT08641.1 long-chain fatty acid--CoA ligase [Reyranella sp. CPCC 100927]